MNVAKRNNFELLNKCRDKKYDVLLLSDLSTRTNIHDNSIKLICEDNNFDAAIVILNKALLLGKIKTTNLYAMVELKEIGINVASFYIRPQHSVVGDYGLSIETLKKFIQLRKRRTLLGGDINVCSDRVGYKKQRILPLGNELVDWILSCQWNILNEKNVHTCTHTKHGGKSTPDWTMATADISHRIEWSIDTEFDGYSDHRMIQILVETSEARNEVKSVIRMSPFLTAITDPCRDDSVDNWYANYTKAIQKATVEREIKSYDYEPPAELKQLKNKITSITRLVYKKGVNAETRWKEMLREMKREHNRKLQEWKDDRIKCYLKSINTDNLFDKIVKPIKRRNNSVTHLMINGEKIMDQHEMIKHLAEHHYAFTPQENFEHITSNRAFDPPINEWEIGLAIDSMKPNKAPGIDGVNVKLIKAWRQRDKTYFDELLMHWWDTQTFPNEFKTANMVILIKNSDKPFTAQNTRLIGLLPVLGKIFERLITYRIGKKLLKDEKLSKNQFGFLPGRCAEHALERIHQLRHENRLRVEIVAALDIKSAFDCVKHSSLIQELNRMGIARNIIELLKSYFTGRKARIQIDGAQETIAVNRGLIQGSKLSPLCFVAAIDKVLKAAESCNTYPEISMEIIAYADDITIVISHKHDYDLVRNILAKTIGSIMNELSTLGLFLSPEKIIFMTNKVNPPGSLRINGQNIKLEEQVKILGVIFDVNRKYDHHLEYIGNKLEDKIKLIHWKMTKGDYLSFEIKKRIAEAVLIPMVTYGSTVWYDKKREIKNKLKAMYRKIAKMITNAYQTSSYAALSVLSKLTPLHIRCMEKDMQREQRIKGIASNGIKLEKRNELNDYPDPWVKPEIIFMGKLNRPVDVTFKPDETVIYTDGSREFDESTNTMSIGAAFVVIKGSTVISTLKFKMFHYNNIFEAETLAIFKGCEYAINNNWQEVKIVSDSLSAVTALAGNKWKSKITLDTVRYILAKKLTLKIWWCKAHIGIIGNELADEAAKDAKKNGLLIYRPPSLSYGDRLIKKLLADIQTKEFVEDEYGRTLKLFLDSPTDEASKYMIVTRETTHIYTGHGPYMSYFYETKRATSNLCSCSDEVQDSKHLLYHCGYFVKDNYTTALSLKLPAGVWQKGWKEVVKYKGFHDMIRNRAWKINTEVRKINHMRILPSGVLATLGLNHGVAEEDQHVVQD